MNLNLLPNQAKFQLKKMRLKKKVTVISIVIGVVWVASILIVFIVKYVFSLQLASSQRAQTKAFNELKTMSDNILLDQQIKFRAKQVGKILNERYEYGKVLTQINQLFSSENVTIQNYEMESRKSFALEGLAIGYKGVNQLEKEINRINKGEVQGFSHAELGFLELNKGVWKFHIVVKLI